MLRTATRDDIAYLVGLWARAGENRARPADREDLVVQLLERDPDAVVVAELDGRLVGSVVVGWDGWRAHLYRLAVDPPLRGQGVARELLAAAEERVRALGGERLDAMVLDDNEGGRAFWASAGFGRQDQWSRWVRPIAD